MQKFRNVKFTLYKPLVGAIMAGGLFIQVSVGGKICDNLGKLTRKLSLHTIAKHSKNDKNASHPLIDCREPASV